MEMCQQREFEDGDRKDRKRISVAVCVPLCSVSSQRGGRSALAVSSTSTDAFALNL
jgi:hypothetical protein